MVIDHKIWLPDSLSSYHNCHNNWTMEEETMTWLKSTVVMLTMC
jgi:hypothetical protein